MDKKYVVYYFGYYEQHKTVPQQLELLATICGWSLHIM